MTPLQFVVTGNPRAIAVSPDGSRLLVANLAGGVAAVEPAGSGVLGTLPTSNTYSVAISPDGRWGYALSYFTDSVIVIDMNTLTLDGTPRPVGEWPLGNGSNFVTPAMIGGATALDITQDSDLATAGFRDYVALRAGTLRLGGNLTTSRIFSILSTSTLDTQTHTATIPNIIGSGTLIKTGSGTLRVTGNASHDSTTVAAGELVVTSTHSGGISTLMGAQVRGTGTIGAITMDTEATLRPGDGGPGILTVGALQFSGADSALTIDITAPRWAAATVVSSRPASPSATA